jgi:eukaryotic-like serine/threonine-protein kinase
MIGQVLGHYRIVAKIGAGGMGEVYRAHDEQLDRDVALKILPVDALANETARKQFRKEALALAKLNHPNIETVYEFSTANGVDILAMELIPGASLSEKLKEGPLPGNEIVYLGTQFVEGLAVAHEKGIVHRDLKPGNLMITPDGRLKILDFGLAKLLQSTRELDMTLSTTTGTEKVSGTVPYMAPEQLRGEPTDVRSDIYSAGAVLYEMTTGQRPFLHTHGPTLMGAILHEAPRPPSSTNRHIMPGLEGVILKALEKEPSRRYQSARELRVALDGVGAGFSPLAKRFRWGMAAMAGGGLLLFLLVGLIFGLNLGGLRDRLLSRSKSGAETAGLLRYPQARRSVAVFGFKNLSGRADESWLSTALSEMLTTELAAGEQLRMIPGENVAQMKINLSLPDADSYAADTLQRLHQHMGVDYIVAGSYIALGKQSGARIRLDLRLQDVAKRDTIASVSETGTEADIFELATAAGAELRRKIGLQEVSLVEAATVRGSFPSTSEAAHLYSEGLVKLRLFDALAARDLFQRAVSLDPNFALAHSGLADAWSLLGYTRTTQAEANKAFELSGNLSREQRLLVEGRYRDVTHDWEKALQVYRALFDFFPDSLEHGLRLARAQTSAGKPNDALKTIEALRRLPFPARGDPRIDLEEANVAQSMGDFKREQASASRAADAAKTQGTKLLLASALYYEAWALQSLGDLKQAADAASQSRKIYDMAGDEFGAARALFVSGAVLAIQGDMTNAARTYQELLGVARRTGNKASEGAALNQRGVILYYQGDLAGAKEMYQEALAICRELDDKHRSASATMNIAQVMYYEGDLTGAAKMFRQSLALGREIGDKDLVGTSLLNLAMLYVRQGNLALAENAYQESYRVFSEAGNKDRESEVHFGLGVVFKTKGELTKARQHHTKALTLRKDMGETTTVAESQMALAELSLEEGHSEVAEGPLREALRVFQSEKLSDDELSAHVLLARALLSLGKTAEAQQEISFATELASKSQQRDTRLNFSIEAARIRAASGQAGDLAQAAESVTAALAEARKYGFVDYQLEARLALGQIEISRGSANGRAHLSALKKDATSSGFLLIARKAAAASR